MIALPPKQALAQVYWHMQHNSDLMTTPNWQAQEVNQVMAEVLHYQFAMKLVHGIDIEAWGKAIEPNLPWAEDHFQERVCGYAINPGVEWANWPWANKAADSREPNGQFNHNYMERFWPKYASDTPTKTAEGVEAEMVDKDLYPIWGIRGEYGDLGDVIDLLVKDPLTRQAYLPVWFPEDTGNANKGRKPCTLGYHFILRNGKLDITYPIRSCDLFRHFDDDVYMAVRLAIHVLQCCRKMNPEAWGQVQLGTLVMNITSLHMFLSDYQLTFKQDHPKRVK